MITDHYNFTRNGRGLRVGCPHHTVELHDMGLVGHTGHGEERSAQVQNDEKDMSIS